jgi:hypothetical protein
MLSNLQNKPIYKPKTNKPEEFEMNQDDRYLEPTPKFPAVRGENEPMIGRRDNTRFSEV